jgi:tRNA threonylcarbamoyladenosine biosynthesis protein TsaE
MISRSKLHTQRFAARLVRQILKQKPKKSGATAIALQGDLGAGKTAFTQGFLKTLGVKHHVTSPTFLIVRKYEISTPLRRGFAHFHHAYHFDLYRIQESKELLDLDFKKIISDPHAIVLIEWPERIKKLLPKNTIWIHFEHGKKESERIIESSI